MASLAAGIALMGCSSTPDPQIAHLREQLNIANATIQSDNATIQSLTQERDSCDSKFSRATILYDTGLFGVETKAWVIPADVEPMVVGQKRGTFSHYDPKTQTETVHFQPKTQ